MLSDLLLGAALAVGQVPATPMPASLPKVMPSLAGQLPAAVPPIAMPAPKSSGTAAMPALQVPPPAQAAPATTAQPLVLKSGETLVANGDGTYRIEAGAAPAAAEAPAEEAAEEKFLLQRLLESSPAGQTLAGNGWKVNGWTQGSFTTGSPRRSALPVPFADRIDQFSLNQNWLHVEKSIDTSKNEFQIGGVADLIIPGTDYRFTPSRNLLTERQRNGELYGIDLFQGYVSAYLPGLGKQGTTVNVGKFATALEYETVQAISTPFLSRSYLFQYNPFTHTGVNAITPLNDDWTISNGLVLGNDNFFGDTARTTYIGQLKWAPKEGNTTVILGASITDPTFDANKNFAYYNVYNLQLIQKLSDKMTYVADMSYSHIDNAPGLGFADWYGLVNYFLYDVNDKVQSKLRVEFFNDSEGFRTGFQGLYTAATYGITWKPRPWLAIMPEVRYDHNSGATGPFESKRDMFIASFGAVVRW